MLEFVASDAGLCHVLPTQVPVFAGRLEGRIQTVVSLRPELLEAVCQPTPPSPSYVTSAMCVLKGPLYQADRSEPTSIGSTDVADQPKAVADWDAAASHGCGAPLMMGG
jgi:hypothetical protein